MNDEPADRPVTLVTGATGAAGPAVCRQLVAAGHQVVAVGRSAGALAVVDEAPGLQREVCDLADPAAVAALADRVRTEHGRIDGLVHLVGGWRGGSRFTDTTDDDWTFLSSRLVDTLRHATLAVHDDLVASPLGRAVIVSATAAARPTAGGPAYAAAKAAAEAWQLALADSLRRRQSGRKTDPVPQTSAAVVLVVTAIGDDPRFTSPAVLAERIAALFDEDAALLNGSRLDLTGR